MGVRLRNYKNIKDIRNLFAQIYEKKAEKNNS